MSIKKVKLKVYDMTCTSCEKRIEKSVKKIKGVSEIKADYIGQYAEIIFDPELCNFNLIKEAIHQAGYSTEKSKSFKTIGILFIAAAILLLGINTGSFNMEDKLEGASYFVLFVIGVISSLHCVGMCGGIMLSQSIGKESSNKLEAMKPSFLYNLGRVTSYTIIGGIIGAIGSVIALSLTAKAVMQLIAGVFMILMGFNMAGFSAFRKFQMKIPISVIKILHKPKPKTPFFIGMLNGLMPCGPLQTMQLYALGTGSALSGALSMFMFAIGTVPLMLTFGAISGILSKGYTKKILKFSGVLIIILGLVMSNRGLALAGMNVSPSSIMSKIGASGNAAASANSTKAVIKDGVQVLTMSADSDGYTPNTLYVKKGMPLKWVVNVKELTGCNSTIVVPDQNIEQKLQDGKNVIEFTPGDHDISFSCWMGMKRGVIKVVDDLKSASSTASSNASGADSSTSGGTPSSNSQTSSIYGNDISQVPTDRLIKKVQVVNNEQTISIKGKGSELEPIVIVANPGRKIKASFDLASFDQPETPFLIMDANTKEIVSEFTGTKGIINVEFTINKTGTFGIYQNEEDLLGVIDIEKDIQSVDLEQIRSKYIQ